MAWATVWMYDRGGALAAVTQEAAGDWASYTLADRHFLAGQPDLELLTTRHNKPDTDRPVSGFSFAKG